ncbi:MAG TPA: hypothetical protein VK902_15740 [Rubrobacter sp.]|nr:hypothetical protein [Rubrobacter sp.]
MWDITIYGEEVLIAGKFSGPTSKQKNLVDGTTGDAIRWYNAPMLKSVYAAHPDAALAWGTRFGG